MVTQSQFLETEQSEEIVAGEGAGGMAWHLKKNLLTLLGGVKKADPLGAVLTPGTSPERGRRASTWSVRN